MKTKTLSLLVFVIFLLIVGCTPATPQPTATPTAGPNNMANPASQNCLDLGGKLDIRTGDDGGQVGYCTLPDGTECEEWALFKKECPAPKP